MGFDGEPQPTSQPKQDVPATAPTLSEIHRTQYAANQFAHLPQHTNPTPVQAPAPVPAPAPAPVPAPVQQAPAPAPAPVPQHTTAGDIQRLQQAAQVANQVDPQTAAKAVKYAAENPDQVKKAVNVAHGAKEATAKAGGVNTMAGCAAVGAGVGLIVSGPIIAVAGAGAMCYAATRDGPVGDVAKTTGQTACTAYGKAKEVNKEYGITDKASHAASGAVTKAKDLNNQYHITSKVSSAASSATAKAKEVDAKHNISGKTAALAVGGMKKLQGLLSSKKNEQPPPPS